jgi:hypothetical protein
MNLDDEILSLHTVSFSSTCSKRAFMGRTIDADQLHFCSSREGDIIFIHELQKHFSLKKASQT